MALVISITRAWDSYILMSFKVLAFLVPPWNEVIIKDHIKISIILHFEKIVCVVQKKNLFSYQEL